MPAARAKHYIITTIVGVFCLLIVFLNTTEKQSTSITEINNLISKLYEKETERRTNQEKGQTRSKDIQSNQKSSSIDIQYLQLFEKEIRGKFQTFHPKFSALETSRHADCIRSLKNDTAKDRKRYFRNQAESEKMRRKHLSFLKPGSVVLEIGGNQGHDTNRMIQLYDPVIITLEPVEELAKRLKELFKDNKKVTVLNFGLGKKENEEFVSVKGNGGDATSMFSNDLGDTSLIIANTTHFLLRIGAGKFEFDLLLINCEGCEYEVIVAAISSGLIRSFKNVQFAAYNLPGLRNKESRYCQIEALLRLSWTTLRRCKASKFLFASRRSVLSH